MAVTPDTDQAFLREVDEELRRDQVAALWRRWGRIALAAVVAGLAVLAGTLWWNSHRQTTRGEQGEKLQTAFDALGAGKVADAQKPLGELEKEGAPGYRATAMFAQADILLEKKDIKGAAAKFAAVAADEKLGKPFRDLAVLRQTSAEFDTLAPQAVVDRLRPLATKDNAWFGSAGEMVAVAYLRMNRPDLAGDMFGKIAREENVPGTIRQRAVQMAGVLGVDAVQQGNTAK